MVLHERRATPSGVFSDATPTLQLDKLGLGPFFRPTALKFVHLEQPLKRQERFARQPRQGRGIGICRTNVTHFALLDEKMAASSDIEISVNRP